MSKKRQRERNRLEAALDQAAAGEAFCRRHQTYLEGHEIYEKQCYKSRIPGRWCKYYERK